MQRIAAIIIPIPKALLLRIGFIVKAKIQIIRTPTTRSAGSPLVETPTNAEIIIIGIAGIIFFLARIIKP